MSGDGIKNVLVVGASGFTTSKFIKAFGAYLQCKSHEEAAKWKPKLNEYSYVYDAVKDTTRTTMQIGNKKFNFIYTSSLDNKDFHVSKQIMLILLHYLRGQKLTAIIFLVRPDSDKFDEDGNYRLCLFSGLQRFADKNILYVCNNDIEKSEQVKKFLDALQVKRNKFYYRESAFLEVSGDNWREDVDFSKLIFNYIGGDEINHLEDFFVQSRLPEKSFLKLADNLMMLLIQIYICLDYTNIMENEVPGLKCSIDDYKKYVTTCYACATWTQKHLYNEYLKMKIPTICHIPCKCPESDTNASKCIIFETRNRSCFQCNHDFNLHTKNYFNLSIKCLDDGYRLSFPSSKTTGTTEIVNNKDKDVVIKILSTFFLYKEQNQEEYNVEKNCRTLLDESDRTHNTIFDNFKREFNREVSKLKEKSNVTTRENIIMCLNVLYQVNRNTGIIPRFMEDVLPKDFQLKITIDEAKETQIKRALDKENQTLRNEILEIKQMLQNANDLNSKLILDMITLSEIRKLNVTEGDETIM